MLTDKQADVIDLYYNDLSLGISEHLLITRQGVRDLSACGSYNEGCGENLGIAKGILKLKGVEAFRRK